MFIMFSLARCHVVHTKQKCVPIQQILDDCHWVLAVNLYDIIFYLCVCVVLSLSLFFSFFFVFLSVFFLYLKIYKFSIFTSFWCSLARLAGHLCIRLIVLFIFVSVFLTFFLFFNFTSCLSSFSLCLFFLAYLVSFLSLSKLNRFKHLS